MDIEKILNSIEKSSFDDGYLKEHLCNYLDLRKEIQDELETAKTSGSHLYIWDVNL